MTAAARDRRTGRFVKTFTITFDTSDGRQVRRGRATAAVETFGTVLMRAADRGDVWSIAVLDATGADATDQFECFQA